ncbi:MAG: YdeI/OmpD-associated family protein [Blastocatellia bacterium]
MTQQFRIVLEADEKYPNVTAITIPFDVEAAFGTRARTAVRGTINGFPYRSSIFPMGGGKFYMVVNKEMREGANAKAGDLLDFVMERDDAPRTIETPSDFAKALKANKAAQAAWEKLSFSHKREYARAIIEAKKPETRTRRIESTIEKLAAMRPAEKKAAKKSKK